MCTINGMTFPAPPCITINSTNVLLETAVFSNNRCKILQTDNLTFISKNLDYCYN